MPLGAQPTSLPACNKCWLKIFNMVQVCTKVFNKQRKTDLTISSVKQNLNML